MKSTITVLLSLFIAISAMADNGWNPNGIFNGAEFYISGWTDYTQQASTPATPASGHDQIYFRTSDGAPVWQDSTGTIHTFGGGGGSGTVTSVSVVTANGLGGTVATATTTPAITLSTTVTGLLSGNGTAISAYTGGNLTDAGTDGITVTGGTGAVIGSGTSLSQHVADTTHNGYLASTDWNTFNGKQSALTFSDSLVNTGGTVTLKNDSATPTASQYYGTNGSSVLGYYNLPASSGITQLTGDVTAGPGSGSQTATVVTVGGATAANIASATSQVIAGDFLEVSGGNQMVGNIEWTTDGGANIGAVGNNRPNAIIAKQTIRNGESTLLGAAALIDGYIQSGQDNNLFAVIGSNTPLVAGGSMGFYSASDFSQGVGLNTPDSDLTTIFIGQILSGTNTEIVQFGRSGTQNIELLSHPLYGDKAAGVPLAYGTQGNLFLEGTSNATPGYTIIGALNRSGFYQGEATQYEMNALQLYNTAFGGVPLNGYAAAEFTREARDSTVQGNAGLNQVQYGGTSFIETNGSGNYTFTGNTHSGTAVLDGITITCNLGSTATACLMVNGIIWAPGLYPVATRILSIDSATQVTLSQVSGSSTTASTIKATGFPQNGNTIGSFGAESYASIPSFGLTNPVSPLDNTTGFIQWSAAEDWTPTANGSNADLFWAQRGTVGGVSPYFDLQFNSSGMVFNPNNGSPENFYYFGSNISGITLNCAGTSTMTGITSTADLSNGMLLHDVAGGCFDTARIISIPSSSSIVVARIDAVTTFGTATGEQVGVYGTISLGRPPGQSGYLFWSATFNWGSVIVNDDFAMMSQDPSYNPANYSGDSGGTAIWSTLYGINNHQFSELHFQETGLGGQTSTPGTPAPSGSRHDIPDEVYYYGTTTNNTPLVLSATGANQLLVNGTYLFDAKCRARQTSGVNHAAYHFSGVFYYESGGTGFATRQGSADTSIVAESSDSNYAAAFTVTGADQNVNITVTGDTANTVDWACNVNREYVF